MNQWARSGRTWIAAPEHRKAVRYLMVSVFNVALGEVVLGASYLFLHWSAQVAAVAAVAIATGPAYILNRTWVWGKVGRSHLFREVVPFWVIAFVYLVLSVGAAQVAAAAAKRLTASRPLQALTIMSAILIASAVLWVIRYFLLDSLVFRRRDPTDSVSLQAVHVRD